MDTAKCHILSSIVKHCLDRPAKDPNFAQWGSSSATSFAMEIGSANPSMKMLCRSKNNRDWCPERKFGILGCLGKGWTFMVETNNFLEYQQIFLKNN